MALVDKQKQQTLHDTLRYSIMATSLWSGVVVAYVNYVSPQQQWLLLRGAAVTKAVDLTQEERGSSRP